MDKLMTCLEVNVVLSTPDILLRFLYAIFNLKLQSLDAIWRQAIP